MASRPLVVATALALATLAAASPRLGAQACDSVVTRTAPGAFSGRRIDSLTIVTMSPDPLPGPAAVVDGIHVRTLTSTISRQLTFAEGDTVDTLRMAETMRRLRRLRYLADAWMTARQCGSTGGVAITLTTRDSWSTRPELKMGGSGMATLGLEERNLFGTGRSAALYARSAGSGIGLGAEVSDPQVPGTNLAAAMSTNSYRDGSDWLAQVSTRRLTIFDPWQVEMAVGGTTYHGTGDTSGVFGREEASLLVARGVHASDAGVVSLMAGAEWERSRLFAGPDLALLGPATVQREFVGVDVGARRESAAYDTLSWLLPDSALADVPLGIEGEVVTGVGRDLVSHLAMMHVDGWIGRVWMVGGSRLLVTDVWTSGFLGDAGWRAGSMRATMSYYAAAPRGLWQARVGAEHLIYPDPDVRALVTTDPVRTLLPRDSRLAETAYSALLERDVHVRPLTRLYALDAAVFGALSVHQTPASAGASQLYAGVVGLGLRLAPRLPGRATFQFNVGYPVTRSAGVPARPFFGVTVVPWLGADRTRDGQLNP